MDNTPSQEDKNICAPCYTWVLEQRKKFSETYYALWGLPLGKDGKCVHLTEVKR